MITALAVLLAISGAASAYYIYTSTTNKDSPTTGEVSQDKDSQESDQSGNSNPDTEGKQDFLDNESKNDSEPAPEFTSDKISISIKETAENVAITTKLLGFSGEGKCELKITKDTTTVAQSAEVIYQPEYSTCAGFSVEKSKLSTGTWKVELTVSDKGKAYSQTSEFTIKP